MRPIRVLREHFSSLYMIFRLSIFEVKSEHSNNYLGMLWEILNPLIQIGIYWFVFDAIRHGKSVKIPHGGKEEDIQFLWWMLSGIVVWFFFNQSLLLGTKSIYTRIRMMSKMSFPMSVIPTIVIAAKFYQHLFLAAIIFALLQFTPYHASIYLIQLPYYMFGLIVFLVSMTLITSTLAAVVRDMTMIVQSVLRVLIYLTPILWNSNSPLVTKVFTINPLTYLVEGYRDSLLGSQWFLVVHWKYTIYFWVLTIILFCLGSVLHVKFRDRFIDYA
jgi:teichoic acid transport system permease protein